MKSLLLLSLLSIASSLCAAEVPLVVDKENSRIQYDVSSTMKSFTGDLTAYDLQLFADPQAVGKITRAELRFRFADLRSGHAKRDQEMRDWQQTEQFPECIFTVTALEGFNNNKNRFTTRGQMIFHGVTRDLVFPVGISLSEDGTYVIDGEARIDTRDFDLPIIRKQLINKVDPVVMIRFRVQARPAPDAT